MIKFTRVERLLHCVVPAVTVRMEAVASVAGQRAVPAEMPDWEAGLECFTWLKLNARQQYPLSEKMWHLVECLLKQRVEAQRSQSGIGGNAEVSHGTAAKNL